ncbi:MAG: M28 family metallopeptidase [Bacteroidales bacterium]
MRHYLNWLALATLLALLSCQPEPDAGDTHTGFSEEAMRTYVQTLGSDEFMGRKPGTVGEEKALDYLQEMFIALGLKPAFGNDFRQKVPMVSVTVQPETTMKLSGKTGHAELEYKKDFVAFSRNLEEPLDLKNSGLVFAGYGIVAPEYNWNDYEGIDVEGKTVVVLVNDPGFATADPDLFNGNAMTYYGRWTYKYEEAARQGAAGLLIVHDDKGAGYPWSVVLNGAVIPKLYLKPSDGYRNRCKVEGWLTADAAERLFQTTGKDLTTLKAKAAEAGFKPVQLDAQLTFGMESSFQEVTSYNIAGMIEGSKYPDEVVIYSAHWDHLGVGEPVNGDSIYNGAVDNGTSLAWMLEIADAFTRKPKAPERSVLFLAPTAEEQGLMGAQYYVQHPAFALEKTVANINNDLMLPYGRYKDVMVTGYGQSELEDMLEPFAGEQKRYIFPDPNPHTGMYYRADHFPFAKAGVPALFARGNCDSREHGKEWARQKEAEWLQNNYHKTTDEYEDWWDLSGTVEDAELLFSLGWKLTNSRTFPKWKEGSEFKAVREEMMKE